MKYVILAGTNIVLIQHISDRTQKKQIHKIDLKMVLTLEVVKILQQNLQTQMCWLYEHLIKQMLS